MYRVPSYANSRGYHLIMYMILVEYNFTNLPYCKILISSSRIGQTVEDQKSSLPNLRSMTTSLNLYVFDVDVCTASTVQGDHSGCAKHSVHI